MTAYSHNVNCITPAMSSNSAPAPFVASASSYNSSTVYPYKAFTQNVSDGWKPDEATTAPHWLKIDLGTAYSVGSYTLSCVNYTATAAPKDFELQGSSDGSTFVAVDTRVDVSWAYGSSPTMQTFTLTTPVSYRYFRLHITELTITQYLFIYEFELIIAPTLGDVAESSESTDTVDCTRYVTADVSESSTSTDDVLGTKDTEIIDVPESSESTDSVSVYQSESICDVSESSESTDTTSVTAGVDVDVSEASGSTDTVDCLDTDVIDVAESSSSVDIVDVTSRSESDTNADLENTFPVFTTDVRTGATVSGTLSTFTTALTATVGPVARIAVDLPGFELTEMLTGAKLDNNEFAPFQTTLVATAEQVETIDVNLPAFTSSTVLLNGAIAAGVATLPCFTGTATTSAATAATIATTLPTFLSDAEASSNIICALSETLPVFSVAATAHVGVIATYAATLPSFNSSIEVIAAAAQTYCMNLIKRELISKFTNFNFNSYAVINGRDIAGSSSGLYSLSGDTDAGSIIQSYISTPALMFVTYLPKKVRGFRIGGRLNGNVTLSVTDGTTTWSDTVDFGDSLLTQIKKGYFQHATRGEYLTFTFTNTEGESFILNNIDIYAQVLER